MDDRHARSCRPNAHHRRDRRLVDGHRASAVHGGSPIVSAAIVAIGSGTAVALVRNQRRQERPVLLIDLLSQPVVALSAIAGFTVFVAQMTIIDSLPFRLQHSYGFSPQEVGAMLAPWPLTTLFVAPLAGTLSDKYPAGLLGGLGMTIAVAALFLIANIPPDPEWFDIAWRMSLCGAGFGLFMSPNARPDHRGDCCAAWRASTLRSAIPTPGKCRTRRSAKLTAPLASSGYCRPTPTPIR